MGTVLWWLGVAAMFALGVTIGVARDRRIIALAITLAVLVTAAWIFADSAGASEPGCQTRHCRLRVIHPYRATFLGPVGACESGGTWNLHTGLTATSPGGEYLGRYQFDLGSWRGAGGRGDPRRRSWLKQAYRAVRWLKINGRDSWPNC
jgi:hypothetical protein